MKTDENSFDPVSAPQRVPFPRIPQIDDFIDEPVPPVNRPRAVHARPGYLLSAGSEVTYPIVAGVDGDELAGVPAPPPRRRPRVRVVAVAVVVVTVTGLQAW